MSLKKVFSGVILGYLTFLSFQTICCARPRILIYTKNGKGFVHKNIPASIECIKNICRDNGWECQATDDPGIFTTEKISTFDVLVFSNTNNETFDTDEQRKVFQEYIRSGGGFVGIHSVCGSERDWPWFVQNTGASFAWHPPLQEFDIKVIDKDHPSTCFLGDTWTKTDECYFMKDMNPDIHVLLAADLSTVDGLDKRFSGRPYSKYYPLCWDHRFEGGWQWYTALGHQISDYSDETFIKHITGGIKWALEKSTASKYSVMSIDLSKEKLTVKYGGRELLSYQRIPMSRPKGGDKFKGSNFIHPLKTPSGFTVTSLQASDHLHHFGLWWPWKYLNVDGRKINTWELQKGQGLIRAMRIVEHNSEINNAGFIAESEYFDCTSPDGSTSVLAEKLEAKVIYPQNRPADGYLLDLTITHRSANNKPVEAVQHRYSGFSLRSTQNWDKDNSTIMTSQGRDRDTSNFTRARWLQLEGDTENGKKAGIVMMSHPDNHNHPERLRTWASSVHHGQPFINFNPVQEKSYMIEPGQNFVRKYRLFVYDGKIKEKQAEQLWQDYSKTFKNKKSGVSK